VGSISGGEVPDRLEAPGGWLLERSETGAAALHQPWPPSELERRRVVRRAVMAGAPALVLGSAQPDEVVDRPALASAGMELVRRRSGGGAVVVSPGAQLWIDIWLPRDDRLWVDDVVAGATWVGDMFCAALGSLGIAGAVAHGGRATRTEWSSLVCFAGMGPGEVSVAGRKVLGLSQRRTRAGARVQCMVLDHWDPRALLAVLALGPEDRRTAAARTAGAAVGLDALLPQLSGAATRLDALARALFARLPG